MWTPKRIVLLAFGVVLFCACYVVYSSCLGGIDGLPPLPEIDWPNPDHGDVAGLPFSRVLKLDEKLVLAFGPECPELKWALKLEMNQKSMVVAAHDFAIEDDGRLKLENMSVALFGKDDGRGIEINTVRAKTAHLTFDKPLGKNEKELGGNRRIVAAELADDIEIVNNHRTPRRDDDLHLIIDKGPLYYDEARRLIWTADNVHVEDDQNKPSPNEVRGQGMEVHLAAAEPAAKPTDKPAAHAKPKTEAFGGVERIVLLSNVDMNLYTTGGFLANPSGGDKVAGGDKAPAPAPAAGDGAAPPAPPARPKSGAAPEQSHTNIYTPGRFEYVFRKDGDVALFDAPEADAAHPEKDDQDVRVDRITTSPDGKGQLHDQLFSQHLELRLAHKEGGPGAHDDHSADHGMEVQSAHAFGKKEVVLASDKQNLTARGYDFLYDARSQLTILKGDPNKPESGMWADQDNNLIRALELRIQDVKGPGGKVWREATAKGPGRLDLYDKKTEKRPTHAEWQDKLVSTKAGDQDLMILTGKASFTDEDHAQTLQADTLKVWLDAPDAGPPNATPAGPSAARRPNHIEADNNVFSKSPQVTIPHAGQLIVYFHDVHDEPTLPPADPLARKAPAPAGREAAKADPSAPPPPPPGAGVGTAPDPAKAEAEPARPIDLTARSVWVWVARGKEKNALERLQAEGDVHVTQAPAKADEKGVDIQGSTLDMTPHPEGNFLVVEGDVAQLLMDKIYIVGPAINIDQATNKAWVNGAGAMRMESTTNFQGDKLAKPVPMTVYWNDEMFFTGGHADFSKGVQAEQENAHLVCKVLNVYFDRPISLKEGNHSGPAPHVKSLTCSQDVRIDDQTLEGGRVVASRRLQAKDEVAMTALEPEEADKANAASPGNVVHVPGPGDLRMFRRGEADDDPLAAPGGAPKPAKPAKPGPKKPANPDAPMKLTYINFHGSMYANSQTNHAVFLENVRVLDMPCENPNIDIDLDVMVGNLPAGAMVLRGDRLDVFDRGDKTKSQKEMIAKGHVNVESRDFNANSEVMTYNEAKDQIIFEGGVGGLATLYKVKQRGGAPQKIEGKKITYIRSTGRFQIDGGDWISGEN